ncbi:MAG: hypothetical protein Q8P56_05625 [Candidatus Uhrbacteria bacterium]|nr:hypothetical protein [Candidatus Uhrbacteria bacterium]
MKQCAQCKKEFEITDSDREFYARLYVPAPSHCPDCRQQRRLAIRNERTFFARTCDKCGKSIISYFSAEKPHTVYCPECWYGDTWDAFQYGKDFDSSRGFFEQFKELYEKVPTLSLDVVNCTDSEYVSYCGDDKRCYLDIAGEANQDCYYCKFVKYSRNCVDCSFVYNAELNYECVNCHRIYGSTFLNKCQDSNTCHFCYDCRNCQDCFGCWNMRNKQYCIFNEQYSKEEYEKRVAQLNRGSCAALEQLKKDFQAHSRDAINRFALLVNCQDCTGDDLNHCKNAQDSFDVTKAEDSKWLYDVLDAKDCYDLNFSLYEPQSSIELISTLNMAQSGFCNASHFCIEVWYSDKCNNSQNLFGCSGLNRQKFCILNKQYSQSEYDALRKKIIERMKESGEWGEYFPVGTSGFGYNETVAQEYFPLTKEECLRLGWPWLDAMPGTKGKETVATDMIPDTIEEVGEDFSKSILACSTCLRNYKIIPQELSFYRKMSIPIPRQCPNCRHAVRNTQAGVRHLWQRRCMCEKADHDHAEQCPAQFETTFAPQRPELVYCESCYQKEII